MSERMYAVSYMDGLNKRTFICTESQIAKEGYICPKTGKAIDPLTLRRSL